MFLEEALTRRLIFVTGKGGVGKTAVAAGLAKLFSSLEKRTALVELDTENVLYRHFSLPPSIAYEEDVSPHLSLHKIQPQHALEEFITEKVHFKGVYKTLFDNRFVNYFLDATPGFSEFLIMGKLWHLAKRDMTPFDTIIVDAPATGHALAMFEVPHIITEAIHSGPLKHLAAGTLNLITDHHRTGIIIVSTPEEMPATEAGVIKEEALRKLDIDVLGLMLNKIQPTFAKNSQKKTIPEKYRSVVKSFLEETELIGKNQQTHIRSLKKAFGKKIIEISLIKEIVEARVSDQIADQILKGYESKKS